MTRIGLKETNGVPISGHFCGRILRLGAPVCRRRLCFVGIQRARSED